MRGFFLSLFYFNVFFVARAFSYFLFAHRVLISLCCIQYSADVGRILYINGYYFIFLAYTKVCSVTELTYWVASPKMVYNWYRI